MEREAGLQVIKPTEPALLRVLESCVRLGWPLLMEDVAEELDAALTPLLLKQTFLQVVTYNTSPKESTSNSVDTIHSIAGDRSD